MQHWQILFSRIVDVNLLGFIEYVCIIIVYIYLN